MVPFDNELIVYVVDDDLHAQTGLIGLLESVGLNWEVFTSPAEFATANHSGKLSCLIVDVRLPPVAFWLNRRRLIVVPFAATCGLSYGPDFSLKRYPMRVTHARLRQKSLFGQYTRCD